jgi:hypothetical protein
MIQKLVFRARSLIGVLSLSAVLLGLQPFIGSVTQARVDSHLMPGVDIDRSLKGDRLDSLPVRGAAERGAAESPAARPLPESPASVPVGCDAAFSPVSSPRLSRIFGRCLT